MRPSTAHLVDGLIQRLAIVWVQTLILSLFLLPLDLLRRHMSNFHRIISSHVLLFVYHALWGCRSCDDAIMKELPFGLGCATNFVIVCRFIFRTGVNISVNPSFWTSFTRTTLCFTSVAIKRRLQIRDRVFLLNSRLRASCTRGSKWRFSLTHTIVHIIPLGFTLFNEFTILESLFTPVRQSDIRRRASNRTLHNIDTSSIHSLFYLYFFFQRDLSILMWIKASRWRWANDSVCSWVSQLRNFGHLFINNESSRACCGAHLFAHLFRIQSVFEFLALVTRRCGWLCLDLLSIILLDLIMSLLILSSLHQLVVHDLRISFIRRLVSGVEIITF